MFDLNAQLLQKFHAPTEITQPLFEGKLPLEAYDLKGPMVQYGDYTWEPVDTSELPILCPLSGRSAAIVLLELEGSRCIAASVLPDVKNDVFASSTKVGSTLANFLSPEHRVYVLLGDEPDPEVNRTLSTILSRLKVIPSNFQVCQAQYSPAMHPLIKDGQFYTVDARIVVSMSTKLANEQPVWAPIAIEP